MTKDRFSAQAKEYAAYRPHYPESLVRMIVSLSQEKGQAWDCATGNGQAAVQLAKFFDHVEATDLSENQIELAPSHERISYGVCRSEKTNFNDDQFDLITAAQAIHWFDREAFFKEAERTLKRGGLLACWGYKLIRFEDKEVDDVVNWYYDTIMGPYWDPERRLIDNEYADIDFPFDPLPVGDFRIALRFSKANLLNYLSSWSSAQNYKQEKDMDPLPIIESKLQETRLASEILPAHFPGFLYVGQKPGI